jgi:nondiscriminating glutamyl-tRNA synthetase
MESIEDFVLLRSDGRPTYNFAAVVDDYRMRITHVIRGTDHLINTPKQILLYRAFGYELPSFAHIPLILGTDRQKLSKRHGATSVGEHRRLGYMPEALLNYLSLLSWSSPSGEELLSREQLAAEVALDRVGASDAIFDRDKLRWLSSRYIQQLPLEALVERLGPFVDRERFPIAVNRFPIAAAAVRDKLSVLSEINDHLEVFTPRLSDAQTAAREILLADPGTRAVVLDAVRERLTGLPEWDDAAIGAAVRAAGKDVGARGRELFLPVRLAITGEEHGSDLGKIAAVLGRDLVLRRLGPEVLRSDSFDVS